MANSIKIEAWSYEEQPKAAPLFHEADHNQPTSVSDAALGDALAKAIREQAEAEAAKSRPSHTRLYINLIALSIVLMCVFLSAYVALKAKQPHPAPVRTLPSPR